MTYVIVPVSEYTQDPVLQELIAMVGTGRLPPTAAQAAIWTRTDNLSWQELAAKSVRTITGYRPYFSPQELTTAQVIVATAEGRVRERADNPSAETKPERVASPRVR